jgi:hypothetical protein
MSHAGSYDSYKIQAMLNRKHTGLLFTVLKDTPKLFYVRGSFLLTCSHGDKRAYVMLPC